VTIIGQSFRSVIQERAQRVTEQQAGYRECEKREMHMIGGFDSFIFVHREVAVTFFVMGAISSGPNQAWVRWLPRLDRHLTEKSAVESILLITGKHHRRDASEILVQENLRPQWCFYCVTWARGTRYPWCKNCCIDSCNGDTCVKHLVSHTCVC